MNKKVLIIDSDIDVIFSVTRILSRDNIEVHSVENTNLALNVMSDSSQVLICDVPISNLDTQLFCDNIRNNFPLVIMIALTNSKDVCGYRKIGFDDFLPKPFSANVLKAAISAAFKKARYWDTIEKE